MGGAWPASALPEMCAAGGPADAHAGPVKSKPILAGGLSFLDIPQGAYRSES